MQLLGGLKRWGLLINLTVLIGSASARIYQPEKSVATPTDNYLLVNRAELEAARRKAEQHPWARHTLDRLIAEAEQSLRAPVRIPKRGEQWSMWYSCRKDGSRLATLNWDPTNWERFKYEFINLGYRDGVYVIEPNDPGRVRYIQ